MLAVGQRFALVSDQRVSWEKPTVALITYESLFLIDSNRFHRDRDGGASVIKQIEQAVTATGAEILVSRMWDERRLAFPVDGHRKGTYWLIYFAVDSRKIPQLNCQLKIMEDLLRFLILKLDDRLAPTMVEFARSGGMVLPTKTAEDLPVAGGPVPLEAGF